ncbi:MAG: sterol desaturase family protein [Bacteroidota bacterium]|nr:sterol desaturase family protein [Bacteroidota bacterium]
MEFVFGQYKPWALTIIVILIAAEITWSIVENKKVYSLKESLANLSIIAGFVLTKFLFAGYQVSVMGFAHKFATIDFPDKPWVYVLAFVLVDFIYYWFHRASHVWKPLWAFHVIHHSGQHMNLTTSYRLNWFSAIIGPFFFMPLAILGIDPQVIVLSYAFNLLYQFLLHTEVINKLGKLEGIIDTPSAHRVHHGSNKIYLDKNFGGVLMIWDRIFKTYEPETEKPIYGTTDGFVSYNPFKLVFHGFVDLVRGKMKYKG